MKKSLIGIVLLSSTLFAPTSVFADSGITTGPKTTHPSAVKSNETTSITITPEGKSAPTSYWDIDSEGAYSGSFTGVSNYNGGIYTNYYFSPSSSNELKVYMNVTSDDIFTTEYAVFLHDKTSGGVVYSNILPIDQGVTVTYPDLDSTHMYYVSWTPLEDYKYIDGSFFVFY